MDKSRDPTINRTYRLPPSLVDRLNSTAAGLRVWPSSLVVYLLERGLDQVERGELTIPTRPAHRCIIFRDREV